MDSRPSFSTISGFLSDKHPDRILMFINRRLMKQLIIEINHGGDYNPHR